MDYNSKIALIKECEKYLILNSFNSCKELIDIYSKLLNQIILKHHYESVDDLQNHDAKILMQMMLSKTLHLKQMIEGVLIGEKNEINNNKIIDPTIIALLLRNIYETVGVFNSIYISSKTKEEKLIAYNLWVISGLKYRQRFEEAAISSGNTKKLINEKLQIEKRCNLIFGTKIFQEMDTENQKIIKNMVKRKSFLIRITQNNNVIELKWQDLVSQMGINNKKSNKIFENIYTYFSFYTHPSNVSVFQYSDMFKPSENTFVEISFLKMLYYFMLTSIFIADYIKLFPSVINMYEEMSIRDQIVINFYNVSCRGYEFSINDKYKLLNLDINKQF